MAEHGPAIAGEVLAVSFGPGDGPEGGSPVTAGDTGSEAGDGTAAAGPWREYADADLELRFWLAVAA